MSGVWERLPDLRIMPCPRLKGISRCPDAQASMAQVFDMRKWLLPNLWLLPDFWSQLARRIRSHCAEEVCTAWGFVGM